MCHNHSVFALYLKILRVKDRDAFPAIIVGNKADLRDQRRVSQIISEIWLS